MAQSPQRVRFGGTRGIAWTAGLLALAACVTLGPPLPPQPYHRVSAEAAAEAEAIGAEECTVCHEDVQGHAPIPTYHADCEACHGPGSVHADSEEPGDIRYPTSEDCLACHEGGRNTHLAWTTGEHARGGVLCSDCHAPHNREPHHLRAAGPVAFASLDDTSKLCVQCHTDVASKLNFPSHHPVREGMLSCTDCHAPHDDRRVALGDRTQQCATCHQDHAGPWVFEHAPVAEDCTLCHDPHGSPSMDLLETAQPALCLSCHSLADSPHFTDTGVPGLTTISGDNPTGSSAISALGSAAAVFYTRCTDCHGAVHGSHEDFRLRR